MQYGYRMSKVALNMAGRTLAGDLKKDKISVALIHPGVVRTSESSFETRSSAIMQYMCHHIQNQCRQFSCIAVLHVQCAVSIFC